MIIFLAQRRTQEYPIISLIFFVKMKNENHVIRFEVASDYTWLGIHQSVTDQWRVNSN